jgi:hypothetical protein
MSYISLISVEIVLRKHELLKDILRSVSPLESHSSFIACLESQASFAAYSFPELALHKISLNNFKNTANEIIDGGFEYLDVVRKEALNKLHAPAVEISAPRSDSKAELIKKTQVLQQQLTQLREHNMHLTYVIREIQSRYQTLASLPTSVVRERHALDMDEIFSILAGLGIVLEHI